MSGGEQDRYVGMVLPKKTGECNSVILALHMHIGNDHVNVGCRLQHGKRLRGIGGLEDLKAVLAQGIRNHQPQQHLILGNQDPWRAGLSFGLRRDCSFHFFP
jgi:hypothetical protein